MLIAYRLSKVHFATLQTEEVCPYCNHKNVVMDIGQLYVDVIFWLCMPSRKIGKAYCTHCNNEIKKKQWSPQLKAFFYRYRRNYKLSKWKRYSFWGTLLFGFIGIPVILFIIGCFIDVDPKKESTKKATPPDQTEMLENLSINSILSANMNPENALGMHERVYFRIANIYGDTIEANPYKDLVPAENMQKYVQGNGFDYTEEVFFSYKQMLENKEIYLFENKYKREIKYTESQRYAGKIYWVVR